MSTPKPPRHSNPTQPRTDPKTQQKVMARAPYNFVPLPTKVVAARPPLPHDRYEGISGWIDCELITRSPTYIRGMLEVEAWAAQKKKKEASQEANEELNERDKRAAAPFFSTEAGDDEAPGTPLIPGSSLRGMIRALVEIVSYSKPSGIADSQLVYRAVGDPSSLGVLYREQLLGPNKTPRNNIRLDYPSPNLKGGYLVQKPKGGWAIQPATLHLGESFVHVKYHHAEPVIKGKDWHDFHSAYVTPAARAAHTSSKRETLTLDVAISPAPLSKVPAPGMVAASLVVSGDMRGKHWHCAIYEQDLNAPLIDIPDTMWQLYKEDSKQDHTSKVRKLSKDGDPLFYLLDEGNLRFFGPTKMLRLPYRHTIHSFIPAALLATEPLDLAESLFGYVRPAKQQENQALAGRVFVTDARLDAAEGDLWYSKAPITPHVLAQPKPTTFQHYLVQDRDKGHEPNEKSKLAHYGTPPEETQIRGHKLYWHRAAPDIHASSEEKQYDKQLTRIRPLKAGVRFNFKVHFENLRDEELGALLWALALPSDDEETRYYHKLGMGKPLGMGAVQICPALYLTSRPARYASLFTTDEQGNLRWEEASHKESEDKKGHYIGEFEKYVFAKIAAEEKGTALSLREVERIRMLLALLQWREGAGEWQELTRYMEIKPNEYERRAVLADPLVVAGGELVAPRAPTPANPPANPSPPRDAGDKPRSTPAPAKPTPKASSESAAPPLSLETAAQPSEEAEEVRRLLVERQAEREAREAQRLQKKEEKKHKPKGKKKR